MGEEVEERRVHVEAEIIALKLLITESGIVCVDGRETGWRKGEGTKEDSKECEGRRGGMRYIRRECVEKARRDEKRSWG